ncbi:acyclic terpene utilization AtuA family protein [Streptomyces sp. CB00455]|uniref:acyclic terpene utilization AtuA family protein n=1 Tax=Streptomyces sp. CB00455 TaxID=1703927 RepID=UPI000AFB0A20|nr:acyclic terpene utilization AtuA family protein [Streptomyces sp. CB00455]
MTASRRRPLRIGNASGFYGDRSGALREMLTGGPLDVLTGDYLAELTMLILGRDRLKDPGLGYAKTFLRELEEGLGLAHDRGVRIVTNAGGLNPAGLAAAVRALAAEVGIPLSVAHVEGDDLMPYAQGALTANAYLGGAGITACLRAGADVVVTGRVTDAALVSGPAAWWFNWAADDHDRLAGAVVAGHVLECGTQATGGNYSFFTAHDVRRPGFPLAEISEDGSSVITKHPGTGGAVTTGTVTAQLLYETQGTRYLGPDVTARLDTVRLSGDGPDRVRVRGVRGEAPPPTLKVGVTRIGGWRNEVVFVLTGLDVEAKAALVRAQLAEALEGVADATWTLSRTDHEDAATQETASALLRLVVRDPSPERVGRGLTSAAIELALASYPGFHVTAPPGPAQPYGVFTSSQIPAAAVPHTAVLPNGTRTPIPPPPAQPLPAPPADAHADATGPPPAPVPGTSPAKPPPRPVPPASGAGRSGRGAGEVSGAQPRGGSAVDSPAGATRRAPLGAVAGARSGDKGGDANVGLWAETDAAWDWLHRTLTVTAFRDLLPETRDLPVVRHELPLLRALNFTVTGILGGGVASGHRFDPQAKALGEWLRSRHLDIPAHLLPPPTPTPAGHPPTAPPSAPAMAPAPAVATLPFPSGPPARGPVPDAEVGS